MTSGRIRERFLEYFEERGHRRVLSSSLIPAEDPTLLFTNAGMNQFKDVFTGREKRDYSRAASAQKCVRAGGKHNDLDNVGYTGRHLTFFEMLGNFSFGDYFKDEAIAFAWELLTDQRKGYGLAPERLWATVFTDDDEAARLWERHLPRQRILRFGESENFWAMGDTGPCGPCSEIHYFLGEDFSRNTAELVNGPGDENVEVWNLVFMQFERDASGKMSPLPKPSVDTGMGLERLTAVLQGVNNNFDTDLFRGIIQDLEDEVRRAGGDARYRGNMVVEDAPFRVVADHARAATMLIHDHAMPSNEGRGYVLRRIIRRALRYGAQLGIREPFLYRLSARVIANYWGIYFDKAKDQLDKQTIEAVLRPEEERFLKTLSQGAVRVGEAIEALRRRGEKVLAGETVFRLYDTHGIPLEVIEEIALDEGLAVDRKGFDENLEAQRARSKASAKFEAADASVYERLSLPVKHSEFRGYPELDFCRLSGAAVVGIVKDGSPVAHLAAGETGEVVTDRTVFYPEGGGQVADTGTWRWAGGAARIADTQKPAPGLIAHRVAVESGVLSVGTNVDMEVPEWVRRRTQANHTGTHLLHAALRKVLGESARQMGSLVAPDRLRFDYAASSAPTPEQIREIERLVNEEILRDTLVTKEHMTMEESRARGAIAFFGEKYGERVRVVDVPGFSTELCGGCHVPRTGEIGAFKIVSDRGLAAGVRRLEAVTSLGAVELLRDDEETLNALSGAAQAPRERLVERWQEREERVRTLERELASLKMKLASGDSGASGASVDVNGVRVVTRIAAGLTIPELRNLSDTLRAKLASGVVVVGTASEGKTSVVAAVTPDLTQRLPASRIAARIGKALGGSGGGKADLAQAGGRNESLLPAALKEAEAAVREMLAGENARAIRP
ncbi:MAG TPA: alanine--tRNA ligase [Thermoanaerobaculia bacterium]|nr:alanine--tRNA ligase [Thermoanaerobaculia bacterium]